ncbi:MAG: response regulator [Cyclobacteriaceae bacterium]
MSEGLSFNSVLSIIQDNDGLIWIGTRDGINKYNGVDNLIYKHSFDDPLSLSNNHVNVVYEDSRKDIWVGTANGLNLLNRKNDTFIRFNVDGSPESISHRYVKCISETQKGKVWVGTSNGLSIYDPNTGNFELARVKEIESNTNNIIGLYNDKNDNIWLCTKGGLFISRNGQSFERVTLNAQLEEGKDLFEIRDIAEDDTGTFWVATEIYGVFSFSFKNERPSEVRNFNTSNSSIISDHVKKLKVINGTLLWCATLDGVCIINTTYTNITNLRSESISQSSFHDIMEDTDGGVWLASYTEGINYYHPQNNLFPFMKKKNNHQGLSDNSVSGFLEADKGLWVATGNGGLDFLDNGTKKFIYYKQENSGISDNNVKSISYDKKGNIWIGTYNGLNYFDLKSNKFTSHFHEPGNTNSLVNNQVHTVHLDDAGLVWVGTNGGGVQIFDPNKKTFTNIPTKFFNINVLYEDSKDRIWVGSNLGLECVDRLTKKLIDISSITGQYNNKLLHINCVTQDSQERIIVGTQNYGMFILTGERVKWYNKSNGLVSNTVNAVLESEKNTYWVSSNDGLSEVILSKEPDTESTIASTSFDVIHGLQSRQFDPGSAMKASNGKLYFGGVNGFNSFYPKDIEKKDFHPLVVVSKLTITDDDPADNSFSYPTQNIAQDSSITLEYSQRNIQLVFAGLNYVNPYQLYYRYKLDESNNWNSLGHQRSINITYLPIGYHELWLQSSSNNEHWGSEYSVLGFTVLPPIWRTWYAYLFYFLLLIVLLYLYFRFSFQWAQMKSSLQMEHFQREKEHELHETKLRFFTDVSHELRTPLTLILAPIENLLKQAKTSDRFRRQLEMIQRNGDRMIQLINQLLDLRKLETGNEKLMIAEGNILAFIKEICLAFDGIAESKGIEVNVSSAQDYVPCWYDRDKLEIVFYNLLSNAFKYTPEHGKIKLEVRQVAAENMPLDMPAKRKYGGIEVTITDSGQGISQGDIDKIFKRYYSKKGKLNDNPTGIGLELAKRMIELHHGIILVKSRVETLDDHGFTSFIIYLPNGNSHFSKEDIISDFKNSDNVSQYTKDFIQRERQLDLPKFEEVSDHIPSRVEKQTVLIVEDNMEVRQFVIELLKSEYELIEAEDGKEGLEQAIQEGPDLIISDVMMPEMNGIELCRHIKKDSRSSHIPVILLTARTAITFKYEGYETGADEYITKPFSASYLKLRIKNLLNQRDILQKHFKTESILEPEELSITSVDEKLLKKAIDYITDNISNTNITVNELSNELGLSRVHFYRKMKALTNMTAIEFIRSIRLRMACQLLEQGKFNIKEVKNLVGFENADYFRKCFKETYNLTPTEYATKFTKQEVKW